MLASGPGSPDPCRVSQWAGGGLGLHYPVLAEIPCAWKPWKRNASQSCLSVDVPALLQASQDSADGRILELKQTVRQEVERHSTMEQMDILAQVAWTLPAELLDEFGIADEVWASVRSLLFREHLWACAKHGPCDGWQGL